MARRSRSARSDMSDNDVDGMAERELEYQRLCRQHRIMENDRKAYCQESQDLIKRQKSEISCLECCQKEEMTELRLIESRSNQSKDERLTEDLGELGRAKSTVDQEIEDEKKKHEELKAQIREMEKKNKDLNKNRGGNSSSCSHTAGSAKNTRKMEQQLQLANNKFCKALEVNKELRSEIDSLRVERKRFDDIYKKLDKERQSLQQETGKIIDESTQAYDQRDEAQAKMILLKEKADKDLQQHNAEMKELCRIIDHDRKLREFMNTKGSERQEEAQMVAWRQRKEAMEAEKKKANQTDSVESYEAAYERIKEITGEEDMNTMVEKFIMEEDRNFALFNFVNEQNNQIEMLQEKIEEIKEDICKFDAQGVELESQRQTILKSLEEKQSSASKEASNYDDKYKGVAKILDQLEAGVDSLFNKINCDKAAIDDMLGKDEGVTDQNMTQYLGVIEERTNQLLLMQAYLTSQKDYEEYVKNKTSLIGDGPKPHASAPPMMAPTVGDEYDSEGSLESDDDRPMTRGELINKAMRSVKKRESAMKRNEFRYDLSDARTKTKKGKK